MTDEETPFDEWVDSLSEGWWDDAGDACEFLSSLEAAFDAGWDAAKEDSLSG